MISGEFRSVQHKWQLVIAIRDHFLPSLALSKLTDFDFMPDRF